jgi:membrane fusion protein (multidrug efflux system)
MIETDNAYVRADFITIAPRVAGNIVEVGVRDNQFVKSGDILARIEDRDYRAKVKLAEGALAATKASIAAQQAHIDRLDAEQKQQASTIAQSMATLQAREADAHFAELELARQKTLSDKQWTSTRNLQTAEADARKTTASVAEARAMLETSRLKLPIIKTEREGAVADLQKAIGEAVQAQAALDIARIDLARTVLRAPTDGQVGQRALRVGQYAEVGTPLLAIVPNDVYVVANYKETQADHIRPGQPATIVVDTFDGMMLTGKVDSFAPATGAEFALLPPDNATGNFTKIVQRLPLRIKIDRAQLRYDELRPGMSVETIVDTRTTNP